MLCRAGAGHAFRQSVRPDRIKDCNILTINNKIKRLGPRSKAESNPRAIHRTKAYADVWTSKRRGDAVVGRRPGLSGVTPATRPETPLAVASRRALRCGRVPARRRRRQPPISLRPAEGRPGAATPPTAAGVSVHRERWPATDPLCRPTTRPLLLTWRSCRSTRPSRRRRRRPSTFPPSRGEGAQRGDVAIGGRVLPRQERRPATDAPYRPATPPPLLPWASPQIHASGAAAPSPTFDVPRPALEARRRDDAGRRPASTIRSEPRPAPRSALPQGEPPLPASPHRQPGLRRPNGRGRKPRRTTPRLGSCPVAAPRLRRRCSRRPRGQESLRR